MRRHATFRHLIGTAAGGLLALASPLPLSAPAHAAGTSAPVDRNIAWAGYSAQAPAGDSFLWASTRFTVPKASCPARGTTDAAFWVGAGGTSGNSQLVQLGVDSSCVNGSASYWAWTEVLPATSVTITGPLSSLRPGDQVTAGLDRATPTSTSWDLDMSVTRAGQPYTSWTGTVTAPGQAGTSAECITERPDHPYMVGLTLWPRKYPVTDFGTVRYTDCSGGVSGADGSHNGSLATGRAQGQTWQVTRYGAVQDFLDPLHWPPELVPLSGGKELVWPTTPKAPTSVESSATPFSTVWLLGS